MEENMDPKAPTRSMFSAHRKIFPEGKCNYFGLLNLSKGFCYLMNTIYSG